MLNPIKGSSSRINLMEKEFMNGQMVDGMKVSGQADKWMVMEHINGLMEKNTKEDFRRIRDMGQEL